MAFPERIVCLAAEIPEILYRLGALERVVGISAYTTRPREASSIPKVSGFQFGSPDKIMELEPDLIILTSGVQRDLGHQLAARGATLLHFNPHRFQELYDTIRIVGNVVNKPMEAEKLNDEIQREVAKIEPIVQRFTTRPRVYFEEWMDPHLCGTGWVSDLIELAGGKDVFREKAIHGRNASERTVTDDEVIRVQPDIILASWCGKPFDEPSFMRRQGYDAIPAVEMSQVYEVESQILQFGPMLVDSLKNLVDIIHRA